MTDNMVIWDAVSKTDPAYTKHVNQRGGFTSVNAQSQVMMATKQFGPIGQGWGYDVIKREMIGDVVVVDVTLWHGERSNVFGPMMGAAVMLGKRIDTDAPKKAITDAVTKLLSQLGFNADIFLGMWDDNKYVQEREREVAKEKEPTPAEIRDALKSKFEKSSPQGLADAWRDNAELKARVASLPEPMQLELQALRDKICKDVDAQQGNGP